MDVDYGGLTAELDIVDSKCGGSSLCPSKEFSMEGDRVGLILRGKGGREVELDHGEEKASYIATIRNYIIMTLALDDRRTIRGYCRSGMWMRQVKLTTADAPVIV